MPLYEYECKQCHRRLEKIQSFSAPPEKVCPKCSGELERVISAPAIQFKGAGWYVNDYAKSVKSAPDSKGEAKPESGNESKSESKDGGSKDSGSSPAAAASDSSTSSSGSPAAKTSAAPPSSNSPGSGKRE